MREHWVGIRELNQENADRVIREAHQVLSQCTPPSESTPVRTGLVCGYVQSGKTASMTAVSALARDNRYRVIVLIAGTTENLVTQNRDRLETHLRAAATDWKWLMLTNPRPETERDDLRALAQEWRSEHYEDEDRRTLFISVMKNYSHLDKLSELLEKAGLGNFPAIIFDDEADQASLNTRPNDPIASSTYRHIEELRRALPRHTYLQYTATPQAPLLITRIDSLSADFAELVSPGESYTGGRDFFARDSLFVELIPQSEIYRDGQLPLEPPQSLLRAMQVFFVGVAAGRLEGGQKHRSMLIHPSKATATHTSYYTWANRLKHDWHEVLLEETDPDREELLREFKRAYEDLERTCQRLPPFEQIQAKLPVAINQTTITPVNSVDGREVRWQNGYSHVLVGGEKLGRGYTVKGLTVTYMPRSPGGWTADTIQQRARFFGYHRDYLGYCRVYLHPDVRRIYEAYVTHEQDMRKRLAEHRGHPLQEWRRLFYMDSRLAPTRRNVLLNPWMRATLDDGWFAPKAPHLSPEDGVHNNRFLGQLKGLDFRKHETYPRHHYAFVALREFFERVLVPLSYLYEDDALGLCVANCNLKTLLERDENALCKVYLMDGGRVRQRSLRNGLIPQLFQGRSSAGSVSYPGDRAFSDPNLPTLQIHQLSLSEGGRVIDNIQALAIKLGQHEDVLLHDD
ncbi:MAG TPA: Z1 domain-containing protein [Thermoanaerobaculia bacterium]|nr:Z1 domain-containing protein [Thermoanaerobaculia bacterium]